MVELLKGALLVSVLMVGWVLVQLAWRRVFPEGGSDGDALALRNHCHGCESDSCAANDPPDF